MIAEYLLAGILVIIPPPNANQDEMPAAVDVVDSPSRISPDTPTLAIAAPDESRVEAGAAKPARRWGVVRWKRLGWFRRVPVYGWIEAQKKLSDNKSNCVGST
jgi:hypothetical protein